MAWLIDWLIGWLIDWLIDWFFDHWLIGWLIGWLINRLIGWLIDWLINWLIDWLVDCLIDWLTAYILLRAMSTFLKSRRIWWCLSCAANFKPECLKNLWYVILVTLCVVYPHIIYCPHTCVLCRKLSIIWQLLMMMSELLRCWRISSEFILVTEFPWYVSIRMHV